MPQEGVNTVKKYYPDAQVVGKIERSPGISLNGKKLF